MWSGGYTGMSRARPDVVCDAGPLIHLDELGSLDLLADFRAVLVPEQVWKEVEHHRPDALASYGPEFECVPVVLSEEPSFRALVRALVLDLGEQAALSLMALHPDAILLTDDAAARLAAKGLGYRVHGSIGVLPRAMRRQQRSRDEVLTLLRDISERSSLHLRAQLLQEIIARVENKVPE